MLPIKIITRFFLQQIKLFDTPLLKLIYELVSLEIDSRAAFSLNQTKKNAIQPKIKKSNAANKSTAGRK